MRVGVLPLKVMSWKSDLFLFALGYSLRWSYLLMEQMHLGILLSFGIPHKFNPVIDYMSSIDWNGILYY